MSKLLSLGSVVKLSGEDIKFMIIGYYPQENGDSEIFEYMAVKWPSGYEERGVMWFFNNESIKEVLYETSVTESIEHLLDNIVCMMNEMNNIIQGMNLEKLKVSESEQEFELL